MNPMFFEPKPLVVTEDKATQIMESMLLQQYQNSPNLKEYMGCFIAELDILFAETERVYLGRFIEYAFGAQLDVLGIILGQSRAVELPTAWFGFTDAGTVTISGIAGFSDEATPSDGGIFRDENSQGFNVTPLDDLTYRRLLLVKAMCNNLVSVDVNTQYNLIQTLIGKVPKVMKLTSTVVNTVALEVSALDVSLAETALIYYTSKYFMPTGHTLTITRT
jgi:hypothetical protein